MNKKTIIGNYAILFFTGFAAILICSQVASAASGFMEVDDILLTVTVPTNDCLTEAPSHNNGVIYYPSTVEGEGTPIAGVGPFPLIVYGHGMRLTCAAAGDFRELSNILRPLAEQGFVIISTDLHWVGNEVPTINDGILARKEVMKDTVNYMLGLNQDASSLFFHKIRASGIGVMGHSMGGMTSTYVAAEFPGITSMALLSPAPTYEADDTPIGDFSPNPLLIIYGLNEIGSLDDPFHILYDAAGPTKYLVSIEGANHFGFYNHVSDSSDPPADIDRTTQQSIARAYLNAFFRSHLLCDSSQFMYFRGDHLVDGARIEAGHYEYSSYYMVQDPDGDGLNNCQERASGSDPADTDSDDDGLSDGDEVNLHRTSPIDSDTDNDGLSDREEIDRGSDPVLREEPDRFEPNDTRDDATIVTFDHPDILVGGIQNDDSVSWDAQYESLNLHNRFDIDKFLFTLPASESVYDNVYDGRGLPESGTISIFQGVDLSGHLLYDHYVFSGVLRIRADSDFSPFNEFLRLYAPGAGAYLPGTELTFTNPRTAGMTGELLLTFGERTSTRRTYPVYDLSIDYQINIDKIPASAADWLFPLPDPNQNLPIFPPSVFPCPGGNLPICQLDPNEFFDARHPMTPQPCLTCTEYLYFRWDVSSQFDMRFLSEVDLSFDVVNAEQKRVGEAVIVPQDWPVSERPFFMTAGTGAVTASETEGSSNIIQKRLLIPELEPGFYVLLVTGPESTYQVNFIPPDTDGDGIVDPFDLCPDHAENVNGFLDADGCPDIDDLSARAKSGKVDLVWTHIDGAVGYNIYRSNKPGGSYNLIAENHQTLYCAYADYDVTNGNTYYYVIRWLDADGNEMPNSNEASATPQARTRSR